MVFLVCFVCFFLMLFFAFILYIIILICTHAGFLFFRLAIHSFIHWFIVHSLYHLSTFLCNLPAGHSKNEAVARFAEYRFTDRVIFSSKITFLYHPYFSIFRNLNKLNNIAYGNQYYLQHLQRFLATAPEVGEDSSWFLCYRATSGSWSKTIFHQKCDHKRNTVTIIRKGSYVFGGYTDFPWGKILHWLLSIFSR